MKRRNKKRLNVISVFLVFDMLIIFSIFRISNASYSSEAIGSADMEVALYAFRYGGMQNVDSLDSEMNNETIDVNLGDLLPGETKYYKFRIYNTDDQNVKADTDISYDLKIITTTNIDLDYELYLNQSAFSSNANDLLLDNNLSEVGTDEWGTYFRTFVVPEKCFKYDDVKYDEYTLKVTFPEEYKNIEYQDLIESIKIQLLSRQVFEDDLAYQNNICR